MALYGNKGVGNPHPIGSNCRRANARENRISATPHVLQWLHSLWKRPSEIQKVCGPVCSTLAPEKACMRQRRADACDLDPLIYVRDQLHNELHFERSQYYAEVNITLLVACVTVCVAQLNEYTASMAANDYVFN